ncbi:AbrB family transcriptional regulator [Ectobacillus panaciterrae]|uniref:AbrB family transcriptional regulator n=1 Tax=Ectobacillus panaciterrae TaxID=363872 RepID=UPI0003FC2F9C|nr:AbrB family transcriptional regulator [Ectobacillus panaciterrae]
MRAQFILQQSSFIVISGLGGYALSLTGISIGWLIGTLITAGILSLWQPNWVEIAFSLKGMQNSWRPLGQSILGIELGQKIDASVLRTLHENWLTIITMIPLSIIFALISGMVLKRMSNTDLLTSFFAATPGGLSVMPSIAEEVGANTAIVSIVQTIRVFLVVCTIPLFSIYVSGDNISSGSIPSHTALNTFGAVPVFWTLALAVSSVAGYFIGKCLKIPAPWLVGGMLVVALVKTTSIMQFGENIAAWWPHWLIIAAQILIGSSIGSRLDKSMFIGTKKMIIAGLLSSLILLFATVLCAFVVTELTNIPFITAILALAPGGIAEMATTSVALHADAAFVVTVQVLRVIAIVSILPPLFKLLHTRSYKRNTRKIS